MKKVYLDNLPKWEIGPYRGKINWQCSVGYKVKFIYEDIEGEIKIVGYKDRYLELSYNNKIISMTTGNFQKCYLGELLNVVTKQYKYNIGDIVNELKILDYIRVKNGKNTQKGYKVKCIKDGYIHEKAEKDLECGRGCPVCCNQKIIKGINDIATTHPEFTKYFVNVEDSYKCSIGNSKHKFLFKCPNCKHKKRMRIADLIRNGIACPKCSDGKSYPEKFVFSLLEQLGVDFEIEKVFEWAKNKRYDFYIPSFSCVVETHGGQHYRDSVNSKWDGLEMTQQNDKLKKEFAINNGINKYIVLNCKESNVEYIKNNIFNSELNVLFDLSKINWLKCHKFACNSRVKEACDLWNNGVESITKISSIMKLSRGAVLKYINQGTELGWCNYNGKDVHIKSNRENARKIQKLLGKKCKIILNDKDIVYPSKSKCLKENNLSKHIFNKLVESKEPFKPNQRYHKYLMHLEGMRIEYI